MVDQIRQSSTLLIDDIGTLVAVPAGPLAGQRMRELPVIRDATLLVKDGRIAWFGPAGDTPADRGCTGDDGRSSADGDRRRPCRTALRRLRGIPG